MNIFHPSYDLINYEKWRLTFEGGTPFIDKYLQKFSARETDPDFAVRKQITYVPAHAKAALIDIRNAIFQRLTDVVRKDGPQSYLQAVSGENRGVDFKGNSMNSFLGRFILPELLVMSRVGVYVDRPALEGQLTLADDSPSPYLYWYKAENIKSWHYNRLGELDAVLLEDCIEDLDTGTGLVCGSHTEQRLVKLNEAGFVEVTFFRSIKQASANLPDSIETETVQLGLRKIPFVMLELSSSLLEDVADYQIALLNLASSDMNYAFKSNFPFYTEQRDQMADLAGYNMPGPGNAATVKSINVGPMQGRVYGKSLERPGFIHPSSEPLKASMEKQDRLIVEIRQLINLALASVKPVRASAESKQMDNQGLEAGLSYIGLELEYAEREIAKIWTLYDGADSAPFVKYPDNYQLRTDKERRQEADELTKLKAAVPSVTYQKEICKQVARVTVGSKVDQETLAKIDDEINNAIVVESDPDTIRSDHEAGFVSTRTASLSRGYAEGESDQAAKDHAVRLARIAAAQSQGARGVADVGSPEDGSNEKLLSRQTDADPTTESKIRGEA